MRYRGSNAHRRAADLRPRNRRHHSLRFAARFQIAILIRKLHHAPGIRHIHELRIRSRWIEGNPEGLVKTGREHLHRLRAPIRSDSAQHTDLSFLTLSDEKIAVRRGSNQSRLAQSGRDLINLESRQRLRPCITRPRYHTRIVVRRFRRIRLRQIGGLNQSTDTRRIFTPVAIGALALQEFPTGRWQGTNFVCTAFGRHRSGTARGGFSASVISLQCGNRKRQKHRDGSNRKAPFEIHLSGIHGNCASAGPDHPCM